MDVDIPSLLKTLYIADIPDKIDNNKRNIHFYTFRRGFWLFLL